MVVVACEVSWVGSIRNNCKLVDKLQEAHIVGWLPLEDVIEIRGRRMAVVPCTPPSVLMGRSKLGLMLGLMGLVLHQSRECHTSGGLCRRWWVAMVMGWALGRIGLV